MNIYQEINLKYPPASINNARSIVRGWVDGFLRHPSNSKRDTIEADTGFLADHDDKDWGNEPKQLQDN